MEEVGGEVGERRGVGGRVVRSVFFFQKASDGDGDDEKRHSCHRGTILRRKECKWWPAATVDLW